MQFSEGRFADLTSDYAIVYDMDALKILTRSTNLSRPSSKSATQQLTPSAGEAFNPQLFGDAPNGTVDNSVTNHDVNHKGKKRKRGQDVPTTLSSVPKELDFFNDSTAAKDFPKSESTGSGTVIAGTEEAREELLSGNHETVKADEELPEEECKRILRSHKVKITRLWTSPIHTNDTAEDGKKTKRKRKAAELVDEGAKKSKKQTLDIIPQPLTSFSQLRSRYDLPPKLARNIEEQGYNVPTEVQLGSLPLLLGSYATNEAKNASGLDVKRPIDGLSAPGLDMDLLTVAPTGSGKTLAFLIPVLCAILKERKSNNQGVSHPGVSDDMSGPKAVVIAPTRELASQIVNEGRKLTKQTGLKVSLMRKGMRLVNKNSGPPDLNGEDDPDDDELSNPDSNNDKNEKPSEVPVVRSDIIVSTPLTLLHAITEGNGKVNSLPSVRYLVLDEADVLLDVLFREQTLKIWSACTSALLRVNLWSATMGSSIEDMAKSTIERRWKDIPKLQAASVERAPLVRLVVGLKDSAIPNISHRLVYAASEQGKLMALRQLLRPIAASIKDGPALQPPFLVFTQTIPRAVALHSELLYDIPQEAGGSSRIAVLHADLSDSARERVMTRFRKGEIWILITTDLLSRGVDFRGVNGVVNYDFPNSSAVYIHRVGRTGRAGRQGGVAVTLYAKEDIPFVKNVANVIAASERQNGTKADGKGLQQWLLDAMPKPSKKDKQQLKKRGVESRRTGYVPQGKGESMAQTRISTKSGFERRLENNKRGAMHGTKNKVAGETTRSAMEEDDFSGFED